MTPAAPIVRPSFAKLAKGVLGITLTLTLMLSGLAVVSMMFGSPEDAGGESEEPAQESKEAPAKVDYAALAEVRSEDVSAARKVVETCYGKLTEPDDFDLFVKWDSISGEGPGVNWIYVNHEFASVISMWTPDQVLRGERELIADADMRSHAQLMRQLTGTTLAEREVIRLIVGAIIASRHDESGMLKLSPEVPSIDLGNGTSVELGLSVQSPKDPEDGWFKGLFMFSFSFHYK